MINSKRKSYRIKIFGVLLIISLLVSGCGSKESSKAPKQMIEETGKMIESSKEKVFISEIHKILEAGEVYFLEHQGISEVLITDLIKSGYIAFTDDNNVYEGRVKKNNNALSIYYSNGKYRTKGFIASSDIDSNQIEKISK